MKAVIFPNMVEFPSFSMQRYGKELTAALHKVAGKDWDLEDVECHHVALATKLLPGKAGTMLASRLGRIIKYPWKASRMRGDVFHVLDHSHANLALALPPSKTVMTCHDCIPLLAARGEIAMQADGLKRYTFPIRLKCIKRCAAVIAISESTKRDLVRLGDIPPERIQVVYYGVNKSFSPCPPGGKTVAEERAELWAKYHLPPDTKLILHVNTRNRYKNTPAILEALARLNQKPELKGRVRLLRVGAEMFEDEEALVEKLGLGGQIIHAGRVYGDELLAPYYRAADVFAFPSIWEGFGWPPLEAMACGTPVVASNVASLPEVVGDAGFQVDPHDHEGLAENLARILTEENLRHSLHEKALLRAQQFTWERCAANTLELYARVATASCGSNLARK